MRVCHACGKWQTVDDRSTNALQPHPQDALLVDVCTASGIRWIVGAVGCSDSCADDRLVYSPRDSSGGRGEGGHPGQYFAKGRYFDLNISNTHIAVHNIYTVFHKTWQYVCDHNCGKSWWILIIVHTWKREWVPSASKLFTYLFYTWRKYDVTVTFVTLMSCDSDRVCCMCGKASSSRWLMTQLTNGQHACVLVFVTVVDILNIPCDCQFVFSVLDELYVSHHAWCSG